MQVRNYVFSIHVSVDRKTTVDFLALNAAIRTVVKAYTHSHSKYFPVALCGMSIFCLLLLKLKVLIGQKTSGLISHVTLHFGK